MESLLPFIDAIEASDLLLIDHPSHQRILDGVPGYAAAYQVGGPGTDAAAGLTRRSRA